MNEVVFDMQQYVELIAEFEQYPANQRKFRHFDLLGNFSFHNRIHVGLPYRFTAGRQVNDRNVHGPGVLDSLPWFSVNLIKNSGQ